MDELEPGATAVDPPLLRVAAGGRIRRHRRVTALSGILLFACMFLPAVQACGQPLTPYEVPPLAPPYVFGLVFALVAIARTSRGVWYAVFALHVLVMLVVVMSVAMIPIVPELGILELIIGVVLLLLFGLSGTTEPRVAVAAIVVALVSMLWFGLLAAADDALIGVYLSLASSAGLLLGAVLWLRELSVRSAVEVPAAVARRRGQAAWSDILGR
ncbi:MAG TPA: hypothetical protein VGD37_10795 [Kofleriaceae bacterium]